MVKNNKEIRSPLGPVLIFVDEGLDQRDIKNISHHISSGVIEKNDVLIAEIWFYKYSLDILTSQGFIKRADEKSVTLKIQQIISDVINEMIGSENSGNFTNAKRRELYYSVEFIEKYTQKLAHFIQEKFHRLPDEQLELGFGTGVMLAGMAHVRSQIVNKWPDPDKIKPKEIQRAVELFNAEFKDFIFEMEFNDDTTLEMFESQLMEKLESYRDPQNKVYYLGLCDYAYRGGISNPKELDLNEVIKFIKGPGLDKTQLLREREKFDKYMKYWMPTKIKVPKKLTQIKKGNKKATKQEYDHVRLFLDTGSARYNYEEFTRKGKLIQSKSWETLVGVLPADKMDMIYYFPRGLYELRAYEEGAINLGWTIWKRLNQLARREKRSKFVPNFNEHPIDWDRKYFIKAAGLEHTDKHRKSIANEYLLKMFKRLSEINPPLIESYPETLPAEDDAKIQLVFPDFKQANYLSEFQYRITRALLSRLNR